MFETVIQEKDEQIVTLTMNRPETGNAFNRTLFSELTGAFAACDRDDDVRAVVLTGSGTHFSSGGDIQLMAAGNLIEEDLILLAGGLSGAIRSCSKPVIAMVNGAAVGAGCALALACDFRLMSVKSLLVTGFINMGLSGDTGCLYHLYHHVGLAKALELMALSTPISGEEALRLGLATRTVPEEGLKQATAEFARSFLNRPTAAIARQKRIFWEIFYRDYEQYCRLETELMLASAVTEDHQEAACAFLEKRGPQFKGR